ncbi:MAG TPA: hypothetical protein VFT64_05025 [Rickettsiales bacterium]|nr:hypothetical protein [Rickettsiales bacterium]
MTDTIETNKDIKNSETNTKTKKPVDVATLEKSRATSEMDTESSDPVAVGEASG